MASFCAMPPTLTISSTHTLGKAEIGLGQGRRLRRPRLAVPCAQAQPFLGRLTVSHTQRLSRNKLICAALHARCSTEGQTQTVTRQSSTITIAPIQGKERSPDLDDGGTGFPPRDDDGGGGGGGGGGGPGWTGGFFFFGLLAFLGFLKDQESEGPYRDDR